MNDILRDLRHELEAACAERDRLWKQIEPYWQAYAEASRREVTARAELHKAITDAVKEGGDEQGT